MSETVRQEEMSQNSDPETLPFSLTRTMSSTDNQNSPKEDSRLLDTQRSLSNGARISHGAIDTEKPPAVDNISISSQNSNHGLKFTQLPLVEIPIFLFFLAYKGALPLKEQFVYALLRSLYTNFTNVDDSESIACILFRNSSSDVDRSHVMLDTVVQEESSALLSVLNLVRNVPALFTTLIICSYTDIVGRRWGILFPCLGGALKCSCFLVVSYLGVQSSGLLYAGEIIEGIGGSIMTAQNVAVAYISDICTVEKRSFRFTMIQILHFLGTALGNFIIGYMIQGTGYSISYWYTLVLYLGAALWVLLMLPESAEVTDTPFSISETLVGAVKVFKIYASKHRSTAKKAILFLMLIAVVMDEIILLGRTDVDTLYMLAIPFCWSSVYIGYYQVIFQFKFWHIQLH